MRCQYREQMYKCGDYLDVQIYPVFRQQSGRGKKAKPTSIVQERLNQVNAENRFVRLVHANFTSADLALDLTYSEENRPASEEEAEKNVRNYIRRIKRYYASLNIELRYIITTEYSEKGRIHHHLIISGGADRDELERLWGKGYANSQRLQFDEEGITSKAKYITKRSRYEGKAVYKKRWTGSKNLIKPQAKERTGNVSKRQAKELADEATTALEQAAYFEELYPGYYFSSVSTYHNRINNEYYFHVKMYQKDIKKPKAKKARK